MARILHSLPRAGALALVLAVSVAVCAPSHAGAQGSDPESIYRFGIQQLEDGDVENAINTFRKVLELDPNFALAHSSLGYIYLTRGNLDLAAPSFRRALELDPDLAAAHNGVGLVMKEEPGQKEQALQSFRQALEIEPDYLDARYNMGVTLLEMERYGPAREAFQAVRSSDPEFRDVHYQLGRIALENRDFETAEEEFVEQYRKDPDHRENRLELGRVFYLTERYDRAEDLLLPMIEMYPEYAAPKILLADVYLAVEDYERANQLYLMSYRDFEDEETADRLWEDVVDIARDWEREEYADTELEDMPDFFRKFWKRRDPDPTTPANEVLVEHYRRLRYARQYFSTPITPGGYDDRGTIYLKHGPPDDEVGFPAGDAETRPNLTWEYHTDRRERLIVHFVDRGNGFFERVPSLMEASMKNPLGSFPTQDETTGEIPNVSELWIDQVPIQAYRERATIDPLYDRIANAMEEVARNANGPGGGPEAVRTFQERLETLQSEERFEVLKDIAELDRTNTYENITPPNPLPFNFYTAAFKDIQGKTRVEVYYGIPTAELATERWGEGRKATVELGIAVFDDDWNEMARTNEVREYTSAGPISRDIGAAMVDLNRMVVEPGTYNFAISLKDNNSGRIGVYRDSLVVEGFPGQQLALSDIEMAGRVRETRAGGRFYRNGLEVVPMPSRTFTTEQQVFIYYEIYNLSKDEFGTTQFTTSYTIQPAEEGRRSNILSSAFKALGSLVGLSKTEQVTVEGEEEYGIRAQENKHLELAFPSPSPGIYQLILEVTDNNTGQVTERRQEFMVTPPAEGGGI